jgi:TolB protein
MSANGRDQKRLATGSLGGPSFAPSGKSIAFSRSIGSRLAQVWVMRADGTHQKRLTHTLQNSEAVYAPSGNQIVFVRDNARGTSNIWIMNANGTGQHALTSSGTADNPSVSPNGKQIVFAQPSGAEGLDGIWVMHIDRARARPIVSPGPGDLGDTHPCFSPDGKQIAFWSERHGQGQIWTANANGTGQRQLTHGSSSPLTPNWGPKAG